MTPIVGVSKVQLGRTILATLLDSIQVSIIKYDLIWCFLRLRLSKSNVIIEQESKYYMNDNGWIIEVLES